MAEGFEVGEAYVRIRPRTDSSFESDLERQVTGPLISQARKLAGVFAVGAIAKGGLDELKEQAQVGAQTAAVIRSTGEAAGVSAQHVSDNAKAIEALSGKDKEAVQAGENLLLTFRSVRNEAGAGNDIFDRATSLATDLSVAWGQDLTSSAIQVGKALEDPKLGMVALRRVGITFTEDQRKLITTLEDTGHHLEAQKLILGELEKQVGGSAKAYGETLPGKLERAKNAWDDMTASIVSGAGPALEMAADLVRPVVDLFTELPAPIQATAVALGALAVAGKFDALVTGATALGHAVDDLAIDFTAAGYAGSAATAAMTLGIGAAIAAVISFGNHALAAGKKAQQGLGADQIDWTSIQGGIDGTNKVIDKNNQIADRWGKKQHDIFGQFDLDAMQAARASGAQTEEVVKHQKAQQDALSHLQSDLGVTRERATELADSLHLDISQVPYDKLARELMLVNSGAESADDAMAHLNATATTAAGATDRYAAARFEANAANNQARDATRAAEDAQSRLNDVDRQAADLTRQHTSDVRALADAQRAVADVQDRINHIPRDQAQAQLDLRDATLGVADAQTRLADAKTPAERERAEIDLERAKLRVADAQDAVNKTNQEGESYARDLATAQQGVADAQQRITDEGPAAVKLSQDRARAEQDLATALDNQALAMYVVLQLTSQLEALRQQAEQAYLTPNDQTPQRSYMPRAGGGPTAPHETYQWQEAGPEMYTEGGRDYLRTGNQGGTVSPAPKGGLVYAPVFHVQGHTAEQALKQASDDAFFGLSLLGSGVP